MVSEEFQQILKCDFEGFLPSRSDMTVEEYLEESKIKQQKENEVLKVESAVAALEGLVGQRYGVSVFPDGTSDNYLEAREKFMQRFLSEPVPAMVLDRGYESLYDRISNLNGMASHIIKLYEKHGCVLNFSEEYVNVPIIVLNGESSVSRTDTSMHMNVHRLQFQFKKRKNQLDELLADNWNNDHLYSGDDVYEKFKRLTAMGAVEKINTWYVFSRLNQREFDKLHTGEHLGIQLASLFDNNELNLRLQLIRGNLSKASDMLYRSDESS